MTAKQTGSKLEDIDRQIAMLHEQRARAAADDLLPLRQEYMELVERIQAALQPYGLTASQFFAMEYEAVRKHIENGGQAAPPPPRPRVPPKYRHPTNKTLTWTGRGNKPIWVVDYLDEGGDLDTLLIDKSKATRKPSRTIPPKYRNPKNPEETWTGRGAKPVWVRDYIAAGRSLDNIKIDSEVIQIPSRGRGAKAAKRKQRSGRRAKGR